MLTSTPFPEGVEISVKKTRNKVYRYFYWNPHRGTDREGERIKLPSADKRPADFWREVERYQKNQPADFPAFSVGALTEGFTKPENPEWKKLSEGTREGYMVHVRQLQAAWGHLPARSIKPSHALALRDAMADTPTQANHMLAFSRTLWSWGIPREYSEFNPFGDIVDLETSDSGHVPWPHFVSRHVYQHAPEDLRRMVRLGIATSQRISDLIRLGDLHRERAGIWCRPQKTRKKRRAFFIPLAIADAIEIDGWVETPIMFDNSRWKAPRPQHNRKLYLYGPRGRAYTADSLRARFTRWLDDTDVGKELKRQWSAWLADQVHKYEWDISPEEYDAPTIHGMRGTGILVRYAAGHSVDQIANDIGMSRPRVEQYMRFKDQMEVAAAGPARLRLVEGGG
jgi:integrase